MVGWRERVSVSYNFSPGKRGGDDYKTHIENHFISNGVPPREIKKALSFFELKIQPGLEMIESDIFSPLDTLYSGIAKNGYLGGYRKLASRLEKQGRLSNDYFAPINHPKIFTEKLFQDNDSNLAMGSRKDMNAQFDKWAAKASLFEYSKSHVTFSIETDLQYFVVAKDMSKSEKYNQLRKLKSLLNENVQQGKARKLISNGKMEVYEDAINNGQYKGAFGIDYTAGIGFWKLPIHNARADIETISKSLRKEEEKINKAIEQYFSIALTETIKEFAISNVQSQGF